MGIGKSHSTPEPSEPLASERLDSWKEIAAYLRRDERTVRRWEQEGLPVRRHVHKRKATVYGYKSEIDVWWNDGHARLEVIEPATAGRRWRVVWWAVAGLGLLGVGLGLNVVGVRDRLLGRPLAGEITSIAVLPLKNVSGDPAQDYFADGMTEALITELGKISTLQVISHQSVLGYRGAAKSLPQIARELKVDALLEGAALRSGDRVRVTANLVQAAPERHLWAESYEFNQRDVLAIQGEVARNIASRIRVKLTPQEQARLASSRPVDPEAYEAYLLGRAYFYKMATPTNSIRAKEYFEKAIEKDPGYAPAYASLAELYARTPRGPATRDPRDRRLQARQWAEKALKLDDTLAQAHTALARVTQQEWDWAGAEREYRRAIEFNPSYPLARIWYAQYLCAFQRFEEAVAQAKRAQQLDPVFSEREPLVLGALANVYARAGQRGEALKLLGELKRIEVQEHGYVSRFGIIWAYAGLGHKEQAFAWLERASEEHRDRIVWLNVDVLLEPLRSDPRFHDLVRRVGLPQAKAQ